MNAQNVQEQRQSAIVPSMETPPRRQPGGLVLPILLIGLGVLFMLSTLDIMDWSTWNNIWRLWPLILIAFGLEIIIGRRSMLGSLAVAGLLLVTIALVLALWAWQPYSSQVMTTETISQSLQGASKADLSVDFGAGTLRLTGVSDSNNLVEGSISRGNDETITKDFNVSGDTAYYAIKSKNVWAVSFFDTDRGRRTWDLDITGRVPIDLSVNTGVGDSTLDFAKLNLTDLDLNMGTGNTNITMPAQGSFSAQIDAGVGNVTIDIPEDMAANIQIKPGLGNVVVSGDYSHEGDIYRSLGYDQAQDQLDLEINAGVGNITIRQISAETEPLP